MLSGWLVRLTKFQHHITKFTGNYSQILSIFYLWDQLEGMQSNIWKKHYTMISGDDDDDDGGGGGGGGDDDVSFP